MRVLFHPRAVLRWAMLACALIAGTAAAQSGIANTAHNLSKTGTGNVKAETETQICVFCHTPHNASSTIAGPLWNRNSSGSSYTRYTSASLDADANGFNAEPGGSSLLCLSCHDGMVALGNVRTLRGKAGNIALKDSVDVAVTTMPTGAGVLSGYTRNLQTDLTNDHPISITYDDALAQADGEMTRLTTSNPKQRDVAGKEILGLRTSTYKPLLPLEPTGTGGVGQVQCGTCHDPHLTAQKFLRGNRFQLDTPLGGDFDKTKDQICLACHPKLGTSWAESAHAKPIVADETYVGDAATRRGFPGTPKVWEVACLNCHDTHTAQGSRRLLREGVLAGSSSSAADSFRALAAAAATNELEKSSAIENTCYQCHTGLGTKIIASGNGSVPNIEYEFTGAGRGYRMPIKTDDQTGGSASENHNIRNANFVECRKNLGNTTEAESTLTSHLSAAQKAICDNMTGSSDNRHVECTDCHNPHRVRRSPTFYGTSSDTGDGTLRTHKAGGTTANKGADGNVASGVLRGTWGVEPVYTTVLGNTWPQRPDRYDVKYGDPTSDTTARSQPYLTREYQLCFKCHSDYSNPTTASTYPSLGNTGGGTASGTNGMQRYTNVAAEFASVKFNTSNPDIPGTGTDQGEATNSGTACGTGTGSDCAPTPSPPGGTNNHRSWHPVMYPTGRDKVERGSASFSNIKAPFSTNVGRQTMYCSDCHGDPSSWAAGSGPIDGTVQGPHGSSKPFLLKGNWNLVAATGVVANYTGQTPSNPGVCGNCHQPTSSVSGFAGSNVEASHAWQYKDGVPCTYCHIAVPHGWKNKAFLVNTACMGPESGIIQTYTSGCASMGGQVNAPPYYRNALLRIAEWRRSGNWGEFACGDGTGKTWMTETCQEGW